MAWATSKRPRFWTSSAKSRSNAGGFPIGSLVVVSGPSGAGKTTVVAGLLARRPQLVLSVSATTRRARPNERDGVNYRFIADAEFDELAAEGAFLEWANVHGSRYGTPRAAVEEALALGKTVILEIDVQGARSVRMARPDALLVFVMPPSADVLEARLRGRGTESDEAVAVRMRNAREELVAASDFDVSIVNDDVESAVDELTRILDARATKAP